MMQLPSISVAVQSLPIMVVALMLAATAKAQVANPTAIAPGVGAVDVVQEDGTGFSIFHVQPIRRDLIAVNFFISDGPSGLAWKGTDLSKEVAGKIKVRATDGRTDISVRLEHLPPANGFGPEYLTYVLWAISADGRAHNLGELLLDGGKAHLNASTFLQSFGMIVTAEPYFAVSQPSDVVVAQSVPTHRTDGILQQVNTHYSLLPRGLYANTSGANSVADPLHHLSLMNLELREAEQAHGIAMLAGAGQYAPDIASEVEQDLSNARTPPGKQSESDLVALSFARQATQRAEDARVSTLHKQQAERENEAFRLLADERNQLSNARTALAQTEAQRDQAIRAAEMASVAAERARQAEAASYQDAMRARARLRQQLNAVLRTTETARGLIVDFNGVFFDTDKSSLKTRGKLNLTKVATILSLYPALSVAAEGYTDSTGSSEHNQQLSNERAQSVADFLTTNGVPKSNVTSTGLGESNPVASNATAAGRGKNRRVELVVSGAAIGVQSAPRPTAR